MTLESLWTILVKQWKLVVICFMVVGLGAYIGSKSLTPIYQSSALVQVALSSTTNQADINSLLASDQLVQTEATLAVSDTVMREVASHRKDMTAAAIAGETTATVKTSTQLFETDVQDPIPQRAADLANDIVQTLIKQQFQQFQQSNQHARQQLQQELDTTQQQINDLTSQIAALKSKGAGQGEVAVLQAKLDALQQHYNQLEGVVAQLELAQAQNSNFLRVVQMASPATSPVRPNVLMNSAAGAITGLLLGILLALLYEKLDTRVHTLEAVTELLKWPILATIGRSDSSAEDMLAPKQDANAEAYRILRTNIGFSSIDKRLRTLLVTSSMKGDGKSTVAANMAIFIAKTGKSTLLVDADLHHPTLSEKFGLSADKLGLSNAVLAFSRMPLLLPHSLSPTLPPGFSFDTYVHVTAIPNLRVMPAGPLPPNPPELLASKAMERLCSALANCGAEVVIFDSPPLLGLSDARILASKVDGILMVVDMTRAKKNILKQVKAMVSQTGVTVIGCVVNKQRRDRNDTAYAYYYQMEDQKEAETQAGNPRGPASCSPCPQALPAGNTMHDARPPLPAWEGGSSRRDPMYRVPGGARGGEAIWPSAGGESVWVRGAGYGNGRE